MPIMALKIINKLVEKNRILRYCTDTGYANYREIDYIAKTDDALTFCEIKFK
ncbi:hypothetical protein [Photobacterium carnosum]|uniref:hypothetical protein n=1 Tax=Photobacterium carnosum TaxID=2023717 RepID=UPI001E3F2577|nr:hypothetical protein [Photobacterium carnosum]MCD9527532.1 hypothetical protein [Photobacterium carnosum]